ncbi:PEP-CTERM sorting domain-containing protein [Cerasicoccus fimbriatus]|uniref:PEP-CTERM sorting domain-containing protein n=1 Tax=Cerasicoccus fimbriatus TaxID=3014554 RepID=UPI003CCC8F3A
MAERELRVAPVPPPPPIQSTRFELYQRQTDDRAFDNIVIATEYSDLINAVPEPSTYAAIFGICTLTLVSICRRRA